MTSATEIKLNAIEPALSLDELDMSECFIGPDVIAHFGQCVTLYRREGVRVRPIGVFDDAARAFAALDALDAPVPACD
jgi:hypothetical protein